MATEQFSLCWDNFHKNMSSGMHSLLENEDLVDVTLAIEGQQLKAHKMVLSVCSPYFRSLFSTNPCKHPIVFMKDVSYLVMNDLLTFMYQGEVQVNQENLATFIKTAEALQIKGLTGDNNEIEEATETDSKTNKRPLTEDSKKLIKRSTGPTPKRPKLITTPVISSPPPSPIPVAKIEEPPQQPTTQDIVHFKLEPFDTTIDSNQSDVQYDDSQVESYMDETFETETADEHSMMEGEEPKAGPSADGGSGDSQDIEETAHVSNLSEKSRIKYEWAYGRYEKWCELKNAKNIANEEVVLSYFEHLSDSQKPSSLWACYAMLRNVILKKQLVDISKYKNLMAFLKRSSEGYMPQISRILTKYDVSKFLKEANDDRYLLIKVALIIGLGGACKREDLTNLRMENIKDEGQWIRFSLGTTNKTAREFIVTPGDIDGVDMLRVIRKYIDLRPDQINHSRFFLAYKHCKCTRQPVGINTFGGMPRKIALFLKLPNPEEYTGHCFKKSSASFLAESQVAHLTIKRHVVFGDLIV